MSLPLAGLRVLDLSRVLAGPYATMLLADLGAEVVKVERPGEGDETRAWGPPWAGGESAYFLAVNRGKRSVALDLATEDGRAAALALAARSEVVVENFRPGGLARLGLGWDALRGLNPRLVLCSIRGLRGGRAGYDLVAQAESGLMHVTGPADGPPHKVGVAVVDVLAGLNAAVAILAALHGGGGRRVEVSLEDAALSALVNVAQGALVTGEEAVRHGNAHPSIVPYEPFRAADDWLVVAAPNDGLWRRLCAALGLDGLAADRRFATNPDRVAHRLELVPLLGDAFAREPAAVWLERLAGAGVPCGRVRGVREALADAPTLPVAHPSAGALELVPPGFRLPGEELRPAPPPLLGEHTRAVLAELGLSE